MPKPAGAETTPGYGGRYGESPGKEPVDYEFRARETGNGLGDGVVVVVVGALECLPGTGPPPTLRLVLFKRKLSKVDGPEVLRRPRADERTRPLPVGLLIPCKKAGEDLGTHCSLADGYLCRSVNFAGFSRRVRRLEPLLNDAWRSPRSNARKRPETRGVPATRAYEPADWILWSKRFRSVWRFLLRAS